MKLTNIGRAALATGMSLAIGLGTTACSRDYTVAYVYATSAQNASVSAYAVDFQTGVLTQIPGSPFSAGIGRNPVAEVSSPNGKNLYVISRDDSSVTEFAIGTDGKLYGQNTYNTTGSYPVAAAIDPSGAFLYVAFTYQAGYTPASPGPGGITIFPINTDGTLKDSSKTTVPLGRNPVALAISQPVCAATAIITSNPTCTGSNGSGRTNVYLYAVDQEANPNATVIGFAQNVTTGALQLLSGSSCSGTPTVCTGYKAGVTPSAIAIDPTGNYAYVADKSANLLYGYRITTSTNTPANAGALTSLLSGPFTTGLYPVSISIDPRGKYLMTANYNAQSISSFSINIADGSLGGTSGTAATVGPGPTCVNIETALGIYVFSSNSVSNELSALKMDPNTGALSTVANSPFASGALPSCVVSVPNGSHTQSIVNP